MTDLVLRETATGAVIATLQLDGDGQVTASGQAANVALSVLRSRERSLPASPADAYRHIERYGWANGPLSLSAGQAEELRMPARSARRALRPTA